MGANPHANGGLLLRDLRLPDFRDYAVDVTTAGRDRCRSDARDGHISARRHEAQPRSAQFSSVQPGRNQLQPAGRDVFEATNRAWDARESAVRRSSRARRPRHGDAVRAPVPGLARRLSAHRPARLLLLLRSLHPHRRLDVQPAREMAEGCRDDSVAAADRIAQLSADLARLAPGSQRFQPSGSRLHRSRGQQEGGGHPRLSAARCQLAVVCDRSLSAQPELRQRHRRRQTTGAAMADMDAGDQTLHRGNRYLGLGQQRSGQRA